MKNWLSKKCSDLKNLKRFKVLIILQDPTICLEQPRYDRLCKDSKTTFNIAKTLNKTRQNCTIVLKSKFLRMQLN